MLELIEVCRQKEFYCMHNNVDDLIESALNSKLLFINLESQRLNKKKQEVKNVVEQPIKCGTLIKSSAKNLVPIPSEYEVTSDDESECDVPDKDEYSLVFTTFSNPLFDDNDDFTSSDDELLSDEEVPIEDFKVYSNPFFDDEEINSDEIDPHYFNAESDFVKSLSNRDTLIDSSLKFNFLEEFSGAFMPTSIADKERIRKEHEEYISLIEKLFSINLVPRLLENFQSNTIIETLPTSPIPDDPLFPRPPPKPPDVEFLFDLESNSGEVIAVVMNNNDELNEDKCFNQEERLMFLQMLKMTIIFPSYLSFDFFYHISSILRKGLCKNHQETVKLDNIEHKIERLHQKPDQRTFSAKVKSIKSTS
nr:hypothetical protein [Tanacetum cinerariifolium]